MEEIKDLLTRYQQGRCTPEEIRLLMSYCDGLDEQSLSEPKYTDDLELMQAHGLQRLLLFNYFRRKRWGLQVVG